jgi:ribosomal protein L17
MAHVSGFSKVHQYDDRHTYKSEWAKWTQLEDIALTIDAETRRLQENGYVGDISDKMFKAGRYYFRKKTLSAARPTTALQASTDKDHDDNDNDNDNEDEKLLGQQQQQSGKGGQRRPYITMSKDAIKMMDQHIENMRAADAATIVFKPSLCYDNFYQTKMSSPEMTKEIETIIEKYEKNAAAAASGRAASISPDDLTNEIIDKIKKTYKNRYYKHVSKQNAQ